MLNKDEKKNYLKDFDCYKNGPMHQQKWVNNKFKKFQNDFDGLKQFHCDYCLELWPLNLDYCLQCQIDRIKYSKENDMIPGIDELDFELKKALEDLTRVEEMLISPILVLMIVFRLPGGALTSRGFCANFTQDIQPVITLLPRLPKNLPILILKKRINQTRVDILLLTIDV